MLRQLHIVNLAVIQDVSLELGPGLNCFTGQTGAGKSLILGAFELLLGLRAGGEQMVRPDCSEARVTGLFELGDKQVIARIREAIDIELDHELLITRKIFASGRSAASINGQPATAAMVKALGELLVDVHGQHDHQYLLKPANQLLMLDAYGECETLRDQFAAVHRQWRSLEEKRAALTASTQLRRQQLDLYEFQADEIDQADPMPGELPELQARHNLLSQLKRIQHDADQVHTALSESEGALVDRLQMVTQVMLELAAIDHQLEPLAEQLREHTLGLQENSYELNRYLNRLELDPEELEQVQHRLNTLNRLVAKYGKRDVGSDDPIEPVLAYRREIQEQMQQLRRDNDDLDQIDQEIATLGKQRMALADELGAARRKAAAALKPLIERELADLGMGEAKFDVSLERDADEPAQSHGSPSGFDRIEMMVRTNPGQPPRPLRKIASGGELSRIMLAMKTILAQADRISVLVFDEIDANVGGRLGTVIGGKLRQLTRRSPKARSRSTHQVLCITHLPQIAAYGDHHVRISKHITGKGRSKATQTRVTVLDADTRVEELAEMLAGRQVTATTRKQVLEMLGDAG